MKKVFILFISVTLAGLFLFLFSLTVFGLNYSEPEYEEVLILDSSDFSRNGERDYIALYDAHTIGDPARIHISSEGNDSIPVRVIVKNPSPFQQIDRHRTTPVNESIETVNSPTGNYRFIIKVEDTNHTFQDLDIEIYHSEPIPDDSPILIVAALGCQGGFALIPIGLMGLLVVIAIDNRKLNPPTFDEDLDFDIEEEPQYEYIRPRDRYGYM